MTTKESRLSASEAANESVGGGSYPKSSARIGHTVEKQLNAALYRLLTGECGLHEFTTSLQGWYSCGFWDGQQSLRAQLEDAEDARDLLYERLYYGEELPEIRLRRMRAAAEAHWEAIGAQLEAERGDAQ